MNRRAVYGLMLGMAGAAVACSVAVHETSASHDDGDVQGLNGGADLTDAGDAGPRRVCPTTRLGDGGWQKVDGIDTSDYEFADWDAIKANNPNIQFTFLRVSASLVRVDQRFHADWPEAKRVGLLRGAYQYLSPRFNANAQADLFLQRLHDEGGLLSTDLPPVIDVETTNDLPNDVAMCKIKLWLAKVENATLRVPMVYASWNWSALFTPDAVRYPLWVPNYVATPSQTCPRMPDEWPTWTIWQWGGDTVPGIYSNGDRDGGGSKAMDGGVAVLAESDMNYFNGTRADLDALITNSVSAGNVPTPTLPSNPTHVHSPVADGVVDCSDGCCTLDP